MQGAIYAPDPLLPPKTSRAVSGSRGRPDSRPTAYPRMSSCGTPFTVCGRSRSGASIFFTFVAVDGLQPRLGPHNEPGIRPTSRATMDSPRVRQRGFDEASLFGERRGPKAQSPPVRPRRGAPEEEPVSPARNGRAPRRRPRELHAPGRRRLLRRNRFAHLKSPAAPVPSRIMRLDARAVPPCRTPRPFGCLTGSRNSQPAHHLGVQLAPASKKARTPA